MSGEKFFRWAAACCALTLLSAEMGHAELWRSPLHTLTYVQVEKRLKDPLLDAEQAALLPPEDVFEPLPVDVVTLLAEATVDYDSFLATYLPAAEAEALVASAVEQGLVVLPGLDREISLPWHSFEPGAPTRRSGPDWPAGSPGQPVPGLYLLQFVFPIKPAWLDELPECGARRLASFQNRTVLVQAPSHARLLDCKAAAYYSWIDAYLTTDRAAALHLQADNTPGYWLQYGSPVNPTVKATALALTSMVEETYLSPLDQTSLLLVRTTAPVIRSLIETDPDLLSVTLNSEITLSDERQGQIVAGNHNNTTVTVPGYRNWLTARGLLTPSNQQVVGLIDSGYDDGRALTSEQHPDLENPERLLVPVQTVPSSTGRADQIGHGTLVAGIIAGEGTNNGQTLLGTGGRDPQGFLYGSGISPASRLVMAKVPRGGPTLHLRTAELTTGLDFLRLDPATGLDRAFIVNNSYNTFFDPLLHGGYHYADNQYGQLASFFDSKVIDGHSSAGTQLTTIVFSAGNFAFHHPSGTILRDSVASPGTAKNVITVGATESYRPAPEPPLACQPSTNNQRPPNHDARHIARLGSFSGRGRNFVPAPNAPRVHKVRIKPDLVAPGIRVFSTAPYFSTPEYTAVSGCLKYYPDPSVTHSDFHTYGTGTSFAAPVVSAVAALERKWFLDTSGINASPSLVKAALIATADNLGPSGLAGHDHRPSPNYGWGRVNLNRLTDPARARFFINERPALAVSTGMARSWSRTIDNPASDTYVVLVWSDPPSILGNSQAPLVNNLGLSIQETATSFHWRGNNFRENLAANDNGYSFRFTSPTPVPVVDAINNVEAIFIPANTFASGQQITIKVTGESVTSGAQKFSLYAFNVR